MYNYGQSIGVFWILHAFNNTLHNTFDTITFKSFLKVYMYVCFYFIDINYIYNKNHITHKTRL